MKKFCIIIIAPYIGGGVFGQGSVPKFLTDDSAKSNHPSSNLQYPTLIKLEGVKYVLENKERKTIDIYPGIIAHRAISIKHQ